MILVLADDFSGAAEMAGMAHRHGLHTRVCTRSMAFSSADLVAIDTQTRTAGPEQASKRAHQILLQMRSPDVRWVFKKVDSVLRGFVREELESLCAAQGLERALLLPANPSKQRTLRKGQYWLADQPLHQTHFASDPHFPRLTSQVEGLLAQQGKLPIRVINHITELGSRGIFIPNIERLDQVRLWANEAPADCLLAGGVDFFRSLLNAKGHPEKTDVPTVHDRRQARSRLFVCGSPGALAAGRMAWCKEKAIPIHQCDPAWFADEPLAIPETWLRAMHEDLQNHGTSLLATCASPLSKHLDPGQITERLVQIVEIILARNPVDQLLVEGGETSLVLARALGWDALEVIHASGEGIAELMPRGGGPPTLISKPGSYPWSDEWLV